MKKLMFVTVAFAASICLKAQVNVGIQAGAVSGTQAISGSGITISSEARFGWRAGIVTDIGFGSGLSFMPQLNVVQKGGKYTITTPEMEAKLMYLELPLNFGYQKMGFHFGLGPVVSMGLSGKETAGTESVDVAFDGKANGSDDKSHYKQIAFGGNVFAGYTLPTGLFFTLNYNFDLSSSSVEPDFTQKHKYLGLSVGYLFVHTKR
jgi:hypothetical protein